MIILGVDCSFELLFRLLNILKSNSHLSPIFFLCRRACWPGGLCVHGNLSHLPLPLARVGRGHPERICRLLPHILVHSRSVWCEIDWPMTSFDEFSFDLLKIRVTLWEKLDDIIGRIRLLQKNLQCWFKLTGQNVLNLKFKTRFSQIGLSLGENLWRQNLLNLV